MTPETQYALDLALAGVLTCVVLRDLFVLALPKRAAGRLDH